MAKIKAFVGHSFANEDITIVDTISKMLNSIAKVIPEFSWVHAEPAEPKPIHEKILELIDGKNLFIGICTKKEYVIYPDELDSHFFPSNKQCANKEYFNWKTSDWIIQEIGLAVGLKLDIILFVENGIRQPGGLQGDLEYIEFNREAPEKAYEKFLDMINSLLSRLNESSEISEDESNLIIQESDSETPILNNSLERSPEDIEETEDNWGEWRYEYELTNAVRMDDKEKIEDLTINYFNSKYCIENESNKNYWNAYKEYLFLLYENGGSFNKLKELVELDSNNSVSISHLAQIYEKYEQYENAAEEYKRAANLVKDNNILSQLYYLGEAACALQNGKLPDKTLTLLEEMKSISTYTEECELRILDAEKKIAEINNNDEIYIGAMERELELNPADQDTRFSLAYKYSNIGNNDLALLHYKWIHNKNRSNAVWNNIGAASSKLHLPAKAVKSYCKSQEMNGTIAMGNLANNYIGKGFLNDAKEKCNKALKIENYDKSIPKILSRIDEIEEEEEIKEKNIIDKAKLVSIFYQKLGKASSMPTLKSITPTNWQGPDCTLNISVSDYKFVAEGSYERNNPKSLGLGLFSLANSTSNLSDTNTKDRYKISYHGTVTGHAIIGKLIREKEEKHKNRKATLLEAADTHKLFLMIVSDNGKEISVLERINQNDSEFYSLTPC